MKNTDDFTPHAHHGHHGHHRRCGLGAPLPPESMGYGGFDRRRHGRAFAFAAEAGRPMMGERGPHGGRRARRGQVRDSVLKLLAEQPRNGYQIMTELADRTLGAWSPSPGAVYPCLSLLLDEKLIEACEIDHQKAYRLTETGQAAADALPEAPWAAEAGPQPDDSGARALWGEFRSLAKTLHLAHEQATPEQLAELTADLATLRRTIYARLADAPETA